MSISCISGSMTFGGFNINADIKSLIINNLNGAEYGIESSIITTMVLGMSLFVMISITDCFEVGSWGFDT